MFKLVALAAAAVSAVALVSIAQAGPAATDGDGNVSVLDVALSPPVASSRRAPVGATLTFQEFFGNRNGAQLPRITRTTVELPAGTRSNGRLFVKCDLPDEASEVGTKRCPRASRIGSGTVEADARPTIQEPLSGELAAYNGELRNGNPTVILLADVNVRGSTVTGELDFEADGSTLRSLDPPAGTPQGLFTITKVDVAVRKTARIRRGGRRIRVDLIENPRTCRRGTWRSRSTQEFEGGGSIRALDTAPCVPAA
jgi:hypothetical protein